MSLYTEAAPFLTGAKPGSLKSTIYREYEKKGKNSKLKSDPRQVVVLVTNTLRYKTLLREVIKTSGILKVEKRLKMDIAMLMIYDLIISKNGRINCGKSQLKDAVLRHKTRLKAELTKYKIKHKVTNIEELIEGNDDETPVRWIRINVVRVKDNNIEDVEKQLIGEKILVRGIDEIAVNTIYKDIHVKNLYGIHPSVPITSTKLYKNGLIIIQDRASCFPAEILNPGEGDLLIDACSAPGNKTTHLAAHVNGKPHSITAFERDNKRSEILKKMINMAGAGKCVDIKVQDFTNSDPQEFDQVGGLLVDPSCSGSGIFGRGFDEEKSEQADSERLKKLSEFQYKIVKHALNFPAAECVVYSTCSIHPEENELVVKRLLQDEQVKSQGWRLRPRSKVLPNWSRRGLEDELEKNQAESCVRALPKVDGGIGFFAACFERSF